MVPVSASQPPPESAEPTDAELEALYLAAVRAGRWADADELRAIRKQRRERAAGNVVDMKTARVGSGRLRF
jgi:hypothetical protein